MVRLFEKTTVHALFVSHTFGKSGNVNSDPDACRDVIKTLPAHFRDRVHLVASEYDQSEIKGIISMCDFFVGSRMHACIAALSQAIPMVGVAYSRKFEGVFGSIRVRETVVDARKVDLDKAIRNILIFYEKREKIGIDLKGKVRTAQRQIRATFKEILAQ